MYHFAYLFLSSFFVPCLFNQSYPRFTFLHLSQNLISIYQTPLHWYVWNMWESDRPGKDVNCICRVFSLHCLCSVFSCICESEMMMRCSRRFQTCCSPISYSSCTWQPGHPPALARLPDLPILYFLHFLFHFLASQDALEVMRVTHWVTHWVTY